mgnify:CR=1 FL=1
MSDENAIKLLDESPAEELSDSLPHEQTCNSILNIINNNNKNVLRKVILLSGVRGAGKTTIIQKLIKENKKDKVFITIDAWNAPEDVLKKEFLRSLYRNILLEEDKISESPKLLKKIWFHVLYKCVDRKIKNIDIIHKEKYPKVTILNMLIYTLILGLIIYDISLKTISGKIVNLINKIISIFKDIISMSEYLGYILSASAIFIIIFLIFEFRNNIIKILFPFLYGSSDNYSEYEEGKDLTPYQFEQFIKDFYELYLEFFGEKDIVIAVDNIDRLSKDEEEKFISSLYTFIECMHKGDNKEDNNINTWFILAVDKKSIGKNNSSVDTSFYDKLSPYEVTIPEMNGNMINNFFFDEINNKYRDTFSKDMLNNLRNCDTKSLLDSIKNFEIKTEKDE